MKKLVNQWRMTRDLEKKTEQFNKEHVKRKFLEIEKQKFEITVYLQDFATRKGWSDQKALDILESCKGKYIDVHDRGGGLKVLEVNNDKGTDLTDNVLRFPIGLLEALWEKHGKVFSGIIGFIIGLVPTIYWLIKHL